MDELLLGNSAMLGCLEFVCCRYSPPAAHNVLLAYILKILKITSAPFQDGDGAYLLSNL